MDRAAALLDFRDEADRRERVDQELLANRFCPRETAIAYGTSSAVTWAPDGRSFVCESRCEQTARWAGYRLLTEIRNEHDDTKLDLIWWGTRRTEGGTYAAQFEVTIDE